jgi:pyruvate kinase
MNNQIDLEDMKMRKTKIICTIGPACENEETLTQMCLAGMNVARLNFSHGTHEEHQKKIDLIKQVREKLHLPIAIMLDTKGPEYRIKTFENKKITLADGDTFTFTTEDIVGDQTRVAVTYKRLIDDLTIGDRILVNNGLVIFEVEKLEGTNAICKVITGGELSDRKSMNFPNKVLDHAYLSEQDKSDLLFGIQNEVDFVAASFVSTKQDMVDLRSFLDENGGKDIDVIAKIENRSGVDHIDEICEVADGIMVARGDLGVEIPFMEVPSIQKFLIQKCRLLGKRVITATEMLESMIEKPRPTRAEISDVANAVYDGTSAVMLSGETAAGKHPVEAVRIMAEISEFTEKGINYHHRFRDTEFKIQNNLDAVSHATCSMAIDVDAKVIVVSSITGTTARMVSRFRCPVDIIGMTTNQKAWRKLNLSWGVTPVLSEPFPSVEVVFYHAVLQAKELFHLQKGDNVVLTGGQINGQTGNTNTIKVETI